MDSNKPDFNEAVRELRDAVLDECEKILGPLLRWLNGRIERVWPRG